MRPIVGPPSTSSVPKRPSKKGVPSRDKLSKALGMVSSQASVSSSIRGAQSKSSTTTATTSKSRRKSSSKRPPKLNASSPREAPTEHVRSPLSKVQSSSSSLPTSASTSEKQPATLVIPGFFANSRANAASYTNQENVPSPSKTKSKKNSFSIATTPPVAEDDTRPSSSSQPLSPRRRAAAVVKKTREQSSNSSQITSPRAAAAALAAEQKKSRTKLAQVAKKLSSQVAVADKNLISTDMEATSQALAKISQVMGAAETPMTQKKKTKSRTVASYTVQDDDDDDDDDADTVAVLADLLDKNGEAREPATTLRESKPSATRDDDIKVTHQKRHKKVTVPSGGSGIDTLLHMVSTGNFDGLQQYEEKESNTDPSPVAPQEPKTMGSMDELQERKDTFDSQDSDDLDEDGSTADPDILSKISAFIDKVEKKNHATASDTKNQKDTSSKASDKTNKGSNKSYDDVGAQDVSSNFNIDDLTKMFDEPISPRKRRAAATKRKKAVEKVEEKKSITSASSSTIVEKMPSTDDNGSLDPKESLSTVEDLPSLCSSSMGDNKNNTTTTLKEDVTDTHTTFEKNLIHAQDETGEDAPASVDMKHNDAKSNEGSSSKAADPVCQIRGDLSPRRDISPTSTRCSRGSDPEDSSIKRLPIDPGQADSPERGSDPPVIVDPDTCVRPREDPPEEFEDEASCHEADSEEAKIDTNIKSPKEENVKKAPKSFSPRPKSGPPKPELVVSPRAEKVSEHVLSAETGAESAPINLEDDGVLVVDLTQVDSDVVFNTVEIQPQVIADQDEGAEVDATDHFASLEKLLTMDNPDDDKTVFTNTLSADTEHINNEDGAEAGFKTQTSPSGINVEDTAGLVFETQGGDAFERVLSSEENPLLPHLKKTGDEQCPGSRLQPPGDYSDDAVSDNEDTNRIDKEFYQDSSPIKKAGLTQESAACTSTATPAEENEKDPLQSLVISRGNSDEEVPCEQIEIGLSFVQLTLNEVKSFVDANDLGEGDAVSMERLQELEQLDKNVSSLNDLADAASTVEKAGETASENQKFKTEDATQIELQTKTDDLTSSIPVEAGETASENQNVKAEDATQIEVQTKTDDLASSIPVSTFKFDPNQKPPLYNASGFPGFSANPFLKSRDQDDDSSKGVKRKFSTEVDDKVPPSATKKEDTLGDNTLADQKAGQDNSNISHDNSTTLQTSESSGKKLKEIDADPGATVPSPRAVALSSSHYSEKDSISLNVSSCSDDDYDEEPTKSPVEEAEFTPWKAAPIDVVESFSFGVKSESTVEEPQLAAADPGSPAHDKEPTIVNETCTGQQVPSMAHKDNAESQDHDEGASKQEIQVQETPSAVVEQKQDNEAKIEVPPQVVEATKTREAPEDTKVPEPQKCVEEINEQEKLTDEQSLVNLPETGQSHSAGSPVVSPTVASPDNAEQMDVQENLVLDPPPSGLHEFSSANSKHLIPDEGPEGEDTVTSLEGPPVVIAGPSVDPVEQTSVCESPKEKPPRQPTGWETMIDLTQLDDEDGSSEQESVNTWEVTALKVAPWGKTTEEDQDDDPVVLDEAIATALKTPKEDQTPRAHENKRFDFIQDVDESENISAYFLRMAILKKGGHLPSFNTQAMASFEEKMNLDDNEDCVEVDIDVGFVQKELAPSLSNEHNSWEDDEPGEVSRYVSIEEAGTKMRFPKNALLETISDEDVFSKLTDHDTSGRVVSDPPTTKTPSYDGREDGSVAESIHAPILVESSSSGLAAILDEQFDADPAPLGMTIFRESASYESDNDEWLRKHDLATRKTQQPTKSWLTRTASELQTKLSFAAVEKPKAINGVAAAKKLSMRTTRIRGGRRRNPIPSTGAWKLSYKERTKGHRGYFDVDFFSLFESSAVGPLQSHHLDDAPWESRGTRQHFLHDRSISLSKNWFGKAQRTRGNDRVKQAVSRPKSMEMPMENKPHPEEWTGEWYKTWKKPEKGDNMSQSIESSYSGSGTSRSGTEGSSTRHDSDVASSIIGKSGSHTSNHTGSIYSGSYSTRGVGSSRSSYAESSDPDDYTYVDDDDAPQCGTLTNVKPNIGERVTRIHPDYTSQLRRSRWRMKYFPRGSFPYEK